MIKLDADDIGQLLLVVCGAAVLLAMILSADTCSTTETKDMSAAVQMFNACVARSPNEVFECGRQSEELAVSKIEKVCQ